MVPRAPLFNGSFFVSWSIICQQHLTPISTTFFLPTIAWLRRSVMLHDDSLYNPPCSLSGTKANEVFLAFFQLLKKAPSVQECDATKAISPSQTLVPKSPLVCLTHYYSSYAKPLLLSARRCGLLFNMHSSHFKCTLILAAQSSPKKSSK